jgi:pimeloyl-ACP methyl ester carboxylesterase
MPNVNLNGISLHYEEYGQGTPLVLVHGFSGAGPVWNTFLQPLTEQYRVIVPDLRGHGHSTGSLETIRHKFFAADLVALLDHLKIEKAHFVGHSSGGMCLLFIGCEHPERILSLILVAATYTFDEHARRHMLKVVISDGNQEAIAESRRLHGATHGPDIWKMHREAFLYFSRDPNELPFERTDLARITSPVFILHGDRDDFFPVYIPTFMYNAMPNAELCILPRTGHGLPSEQPELFISLVQKFLARLNP